MPLSPVAVSLIAFITIVASLALSYAVPTGFVALRQAAGRR